jgi:hypothetical protein
MDGGADPMRLLKMGGAFVTVAAAVPLFATATLIGCSVAGVLAGVAVLMAR